MSHTFGRTLREVPADAEHESHRLLLRAGLAQQVAAGVYSYMPLGWRVLRKIEQIVREEMDAAGGQELLMPVLVPSDLLQETGRRDTMASILFALQDRRERELILGPTHEEVAIDLFRRNVQSYRDLPLLLYQIQTKFRDEARPRMGLVRSREFGMMDLYSFHTNTDDLGRAYDRLHQAYDRVFERCGVPAVTVLADSGAIGGKESQEFMLLTEIGEDELVLCPSCHYAANTERAEQRKPVSEETEPRPMNEVSTPGQKTIEAVAAFLKAEPINTLKAVFYMADGQPVVVAIRGDLAVNETKLRNALGVLEIRPMTEEEVVAAGLVAGYASPVGLEKAKVLADDSAQDANLIGGANKPEFHLENVNFGRDWRADIVADIALAGPGDACVNCGTALETGRGIEMGHIFKLLTVWSEKMGAGYLDAEGQEQLAIMGTYGIGTSRVLQCIIEANHDERGIIWPANVAPYQVHIVGLGLDSDEIAAKAEALYGHLRAGGIDVLYDDRTDPTAGVKFNDADLIGLPLRVTVSPRSLEKGAVEVKPRNSADVELVPYEEAVAQIAAAVADA